MWRVALVVSALALLGCKREQSSPAAQSSSLASKPRLEPEVRPELRAALDNLGASEKPRREAALNWVKELAGKLTSDEVAAIIKAASAKLPEHVVIGAYDEDLIETVAKQLQQQHLPLLARQYPELTPYGQRAVIDALVHSQLQGVDQLAIDLLRRHGWMSERAIPKFGDDCPLSEAMIAAFVDGSIRGFDDEKRHGLLLDCATSGKLSARIKEQAQAPTVARALTLLDSLEKRPRSAGVAWRAHEDYVGLRYEAEVLFDLLGHLGPSENSAGALRRGEVLPDPLLALWAAVSLVRLGEQPRSESLLAIAKDAESRNHLLEELTKLEKKALFPKSELTQPKLAESDMVGWLTFPTELGRMPDHIQLMKVVERDTGPEGGVFVYYVFRFKLDPPDERAADGWLAGISGPFRKQEFPTPDSWGETFSTFTAWNKFNAEEHLSSVQELLEEWREHWRQQQADAGEKR